MRDTELDARHAIWKKQGSFAVALDRYDPHKISRRLIGRNDLVDLRYEGGVGRGLLSHCGFRAAICLPHDL